MRKKNGFTLIELLAVIVILAIIALIAVPQVMKILNRARVSAAEDSTYGIYNATQDYISKVMLDNGGDFPGGELIFTCDSTSCKLDNYATLVSEGYNLEETLDYKGKKATGGTIKITDGGKDIIIEGLIINGFTCNYSNEKATCEKGGTSGNNNTNTIGTLASNVHIGDYIEYDPTLGVTDSNLLSYTSPIGELKVKDSNDVYLVNGASGSNTETYNGAYNLLDIDGNFVTDGYTVEADEHGNGYSSHSFQATSSNNVWRVLDVNTTTGVVKIIPENEIKTTANGYFWMKGLRGYKNATTELNNISSIFGHGTGANGSQSITIEDVNALTGYTPATPSSVTVTGSINKAWYNTYYMYQGTTNPGTSGQNSNGIDNAKIYEMLIKRNNTTNRLYWIASPFVGAGSDHASFGVRIVYDGNVGSDSKWCAYTRGLEYPFESSRGVLPVVTLQSSVNYKSGDGTSSASDKIIKFQ